MQDVCILPYARIEIDLASATLSSQDKRFGLLLYHSHKLHVGSSRGHSVLDCFQQGIEKKKHAIQLQCSKTFSAAEPSRECIRRQHVLSIVRAPLTCNNAHACPQRCALTVAQHRSHSCVLTQHACWTATVRTDGSANPCHPTRAGSHLLRLRQQALQQRRVSCSQ